MNIRCVCLISMVVVGCFVPLVVVGGALDTTFNPSGTPPGTVTTVIDASSGVLGVAVQTDGKIVAAGYGLTGGYGHFASDRYNPDGTLDTSFGVDGIVTTSIGDDSGIEAIVLQPDGKIVCAGYASMLGRPDFAVARYNPDGMLDASFGAGGIVITPVGSTSNVIHATALQADGNIVVVGFAMTGTVIQLALARYNSDGTLDTSFGAGTGIVTLLIGTDTRARAVVLQADGKIVVAGSAAIAGVRQFAIERYNTDGSLDVTFGSGTGIVTTAIGTGSSAEGVALRADGKIIVAGTATIGGVTQFVLAQYNPDGTLDGMFNPSGTQPGVVMTVIDSSSNSQINGLALQSDEKMVVAGYTVMGGSTQFALARYNTDGMLDGTFNPSGTQPGTVTTMFDTSPSSRSYGLALQSDGKIVAAGPTVIAGVQQFGVARYTEVISLLESALTRAIKQKYCHILDGV